MTTVKKSFKPLMRPGKNTPPSWRRSAVRLRRVLKRKDVAHLFDVSGTTVTRWTKQVMNGEL